MKDPEEQKEKEEDILSKIHESDELFDELENLVFETKGSVNIEPLLIIPETFEEAERLARIELAKEAAKILDLEDKSLAESLMEDIHEEVAYKCIAAWKLDEKRDSHKSKLLKNINEVHGDYDVYDIAGLLISGMSSEISDNLLMKELAEEEKEDLAG